MVDGGGTGTIAAVVRLEGVDLPGIEIRMLPRHVCEISRFEWFKGVVGGNVVGVGVVPEAVMGRESQLQVGGVVGGGEGNSELLWAWSERRGLVWGDG